MSSAPLSKLLPGVLGGFVSAYGLWTAMTWNSAEKLPRSVTNPEWAPATQQYLAALPRHAAATPVAMNPSRYFS